MQLVKKDVVDNKLDRKATLDRRVKFFFTGDDWAVT